MTDKETIKGLECCEKDDCDNCPNDFGNCYANLAGYALALINRQQAEVERLKEEKLQVVVPLKNCGNSFMVKDAKTIRTEAIKEFAERLKSESILCAGCVPWYDIHDTIDTLVKEMTEEQK